MDEFEHVTQRVRTCTEGFKSGVTREGDMSERSERLDAIAVRGCKV